MSAWSFPLLFMVSVSKNEMRCLLFSKVKLILGWSLLSNVWKRVNSSSARVKIRKQSSRNLLKFVSKYVLKFESNSWAAFSYIVSSRYAKTSVAYIYTYIYPPNHLSIHLSVLQSELCFRSLTLVFFGRFSSNFAHISPQTLGAKP